ncbi:sensor histidine kinase [Rubrolithibacter danxiaensis]|uniref:sensor histidine kinase n=1 Tax=Rubrolithibacter danxiaensis TaxID=3390805 RepID=UPI003BF7BAE6
MKLLTFVRNQRYTFSIAVIIILSSTILILLNHYSIKFLSATRAYVNGESQYSKGQKDAAKHLVSYLDTYDLKYYRLFEQELSVPIGDSIARVEMDKDEDYEKIKSGFIQGRNHSLDIDNMIWLYQNLKGFSYFNCAVHEWKMADAEIRQLHEIGKSIYWKSLDEKFLPEEREQLLKKIDRINDQLTAHQRTFSLVLGEATRLVTSMLLYLNIIFILSIVISAGIFTRNIIKQLVESKAQIEKQNHAKDEFLSIASHELKTPLTSMKASLQILERFARNSNESHQIHPFIQNANKQVNRLTGLVNDLLDVTKIQRGKLQLNKSIVSISELVSEAVEEIRHTTEHHYHILDLPNLYVFADKSRISQVLVNFLTNAAKYSPEGKEIVVFAQPEKESIRICVQDFGIGVPKNKIPLLFERFYRVDETENVVQGLGLGLYISCEIIKNHEGEIGAESEVGTGSTFWFRLPVIQPA